MTTKRHDYDAIVIGSGMTGGWAAKELTEKGLETLVLERGRNVKHPDDYKTAHMNQWDFPHRGQVTQKIKEEYYVQSRHPFDFNEATLPFWVKDKENPYTEVSPFNWFRGYQVGGRSLLWGRQSYRLSDIDFEANAKDGLGIDWPIRYKDIAPWYDYVERFIGVSGHTDGLSQLPDGKFLPPMEMNCLEKYVKAKIEEYYPDRTLIIGRTANLTKPHNNRTQCLYRNRCNRGCPFGAYFSSLSSTLPAAEQTGKMTLLPNSIVNSIIYDEKSGKANGVLVIDAMTGEIHQYSARVIFLCASTLNTTFILLNSKSATFPNGLGNSSGVLGHYLMDHYTSAGVAGIFEGFEDHYYSGRRPNVVLVPRFRNIKEKHPDFVRGYMLSGAAIRTTWNRWDDDGLYESGYGADLKHRLTKPGPWRMWLTSYGECLPYYDNQVTLNNEHKDKWGQPTLSIDCKFRENESKIRQDAARTAEEILNYSGFKDVKNWNYEPVPGSTVHEMGTARMGKEPKTSILNKYNQLHNVPNVFVTDGACMVSSGCQNPSLTYMALTARACDYAVRELKRMNI